MNKNCRKQNKKPFALKKLFVAITRKNRHW